MLIITILPLNQLIEFILMEIKISVQTFMAIHSSGWWNFQWGPKWWTNRTSDQKTSQHWHPLNYTATMGEKQGNTKPKGTEPHCAAILGQWPQSKSKVTWQPGTLIYIIETIFFSVCMYCCLSHKLTLHILNNMVVIHKDTYTTEFDLQIILNEKIHY